MAPTHRAAAFNDAVSDPARNDQLSPGERGAAMMPQRTTEQMKQRGRAYAAFAEAAAPAAQ